MAKKTIAVVGAGVGGLATAARLAHDGHTVRVYEKLPEAGGRAHCIVDRGFRFDTGPSFVLMPDFFDELFAYCGTEIGAYLDLRMLPVHYSIFYADGDTLTIFADSTRTELELERMEPGAGRKYRAFLKETKRIYELVKPLMTRSFSPRSMLNPSYWGLLPRLRVFESFWKLACPFFKTDKLRYAFTFESMFLGVSPFDAPAFYSVITYADHVQKIFHPQGGMYTIPQAFESLARKFGAQFRYNEPVERILPRAGRYVLKLAGGSEEADAVVCNADYPYAQRTLLNRQPRRYHYSCSVFLLYLGLKEKVSGLQHHNLFFGPRIRENLYQIFYEDAYPDEPAFYVHVPTVTDPTVAPAGKDILYILIPVPNLEHQPVEAIDEHKQQLRSYVLRRIAEKIGKQAAELEALIEVEHHFLPGDFISRYNLENGATFGLAHTLFQSAFFRPANQDATLKNMYYAGASTQPGGGLPVVIAGSRIVADLMKNSFR